MMQDTSLEAFEIVKENLGERQLLVFNTIKKLGYCSNAMIGKELSLPINTITPRCYELRKKFLVVFSHKTTCPVTKNKAKFWCLS